MREVLIRPLLLAAVVTAVGCASAPPDPNAPRSCFTVDNSQGDGAIGNVWLMGPSRQQIRIGNLGIGETVTECVQRTGMAGRWYFYVGRASSARIDPALGQTSARQTSDQFIFQQDTEFIWNVRSGQVTLKAVTETTGRR